MSVSSPRSRPRASAIVVTVVVVISSLLTAVVLTSTAAARSTTSGLTASTSPSATPSGSSTSGATPAPAAKNSATPSPTSSSVTAAAPSAAAAPTQVLTIGDSIMKGFGLSSADAWPELISATNGWNLTTLACDGAGFVTPGNPAECGDTLVDVSRSAATLHPDLIIIEGSSNDFGQSNSQLLSATVSALTILRSEFPNAKIIGLSTVWSETAPPAQLADTNSQMQKAVTAVGGHYLDIGQPLGGHSELMQNDDVHPTVAGQKVLAATIQGAIAAEQQAIALQKKQQQEQEQKLKMMSRWEY
jgi:acyl-CoA thioesterase-1